MSLRMHFANTRSDGMLLFPCSHAPEQLRKWLKLRDGHSQVFRTSFIILKYTRAYLNKTGAAVELLPRQIPRQQNLHAIHPDIPPIRGIHHTGVFTSGAVDADARIRRGSNMDVGHR